MNKEHRSQQISSYHTELGSNPPIVADATFEQSLPQLPGDCTPDKSPHAEIFQELSRTKKSAPSEDEVNSKMHRSLSPLGKKEFFANDCVTCGHHQHILRHHISKHTRVPVTQKKVVATSWETTAHYG